MVAWLAPLISGAMSLTGSIIGKAMEKDPQEQRFSSAGFLRGGRPNAPMFPMLSDESTKKGITPANNSLEEFLDSYAPKEYHYKGKYDDGSGENFGLLAQDIEGTKVGNDMLTHKDGKLAVDYGPRSVETLYAIVSDLHRRLKNVEGE